MIGQYLSTFVCPACGRNDKQHQVFYPRTTRHGNEIQLRFNMQCACGKCTPLTVKLPILFLGYLMVRDAILESDMGGDATFTWMTVEPSADNGFLAQRTREYREIMEQLPSGLEPPCTADRTGLNLNEQEWRDFLKRMQLGTDDCAEAGSSGI